MTKRKSRLEKEHPANFLPQYSIQQDSVYITFEKLYHRLSLQCRITATHPAEVFSPDKGSPTAIQSLAGPCAPLVPCPHHVHIHFYLHCGLAK
jgi:hypothetical protein